MNEVPADDLQPVILRRGRFGAASARRALCVDERSTGPWEIDWIELPRIFTLAAGALAQAVFVLEGLEVNGDRMARNLAITKGLITSEAVMMAFAPKMGRGQAHDLLYDVCRKALAGDRTLAEMLTADADITKQLSRDEIDRLTDPARYLGCAGALIDEVVAEVRHALR